MVYAKTKNAAAMLSNQVREGMMNKVYYAVICGKPVDFVGNYVDYLRKTGKLTGRKLWIKRRRGENGQN